MIDINLTEGVTDGKVLHGRRGHVLHRHTDGGTTLTHSVVRALEPNPSN